MTGHPHSPTTLFHYTCRDAAPHVRRTMQLIPGADVPGVNERKLKNLVAPSRAASTLVWLTDLAPPVSRDWLGLTMHSINCDRCECVFAVEQLDGVLWYPRFARLVPALRQLETATGVMPAHWFVAEQPVPVAYEVTAV